MLSRIASPQTIAAVPGMAPGWEFGPRWTHLPCLFALLAWTSWRLGLEDEVAVRATADQAGEARHESAPVDPEDGA